MINLKKTAVAAVLAFGGSAVYAGTMGPVCTPGNVTVPCERMAWDFGVQALYLTPTSGNYLGSVSTTGAAGTVERVSDFGSEWGWGFRLEGSYHFGTGNDLNINWAHLDQDASKNLATGIRLPILDGVPVPAGLFSAHEENEWDAVNVEFGQTVNFGEHKVIRFHGGVQYAGIEKNNDFRVVNSRVAYAKSEFSGFGPRAGMDMSYHFGNGLSMYANPAVTLLAGETKFNSNVISTVPVQSFAKSGSTNIIVPAVEAKLGLMYDYAMAQGVLTLDAGWLMVDYINALQRPGDHNNDFGLNGPAFGAKWVGNIA